jgi:hypothetical protein
MAEGKRPGGLTALAVINFVFSAFSGLGFLGMFVVLALFKNIETAEGEAGEGARRGLEDSGGFEWIIASGVVNALMAVLLLISGIGYLKQKRVMGRMLGSGAAVINLLFSLAFIATIGMQFAMLVGFVYPVLTLILLNTTFKDDLVN